MRTKTISVLICDDHAISRTGLSLVLDREEDISVVGEAGNGQEAVDMFSPERHQLILMDCQMPVLDGYEATAELRRRYSPVSTPILAMTAHAMQGEREKCIAAGMDEYLSKPLKAEELFVMIEKLVRV